MPLILMWKIHTILWLFPGGSRLPATDSALFTFEAIKKLLLKSPNTCISVVYIVLFDSKLEATYEAELQTYNKALSSTSKIFIRQTCLCSVRSKVLLNSSWYFRLCQFHLLSNRSEQFRSN